jgi:predicted nucleic acid-binding protein
MTFDSDVLIWFTRDDPEAIACIDRTQDRSLSVVSLMEVLQGARSRTEMQTFLKSMRLLGFRTLPLTESIGNAALALIEEHALSTGLHLEDALIAATAIENGEALISANDRHFRAIRRLELKTFRPRRRH